MIASPAEMKEVAKKIKCKYCGAIKGRNSTLHIFNDAFETGGSFSVVSPTVQAELEFELNQLRRQQQEAK